MNFFGLLLIAIVTKKWLPNFQEFFLWRNKTFRSILNCNCRSIINVQGAHLRQKIESFSVVVSSWVSCPPSATLWWPQVESGSKPLNTMGLNYFWRSILITIYFYWIYITYFELPRHTDPRPRTFPSMAYRYLRREPTTIFSTIVRYWIITTSGSGLRPTSAGVAAGWPFIPNTPFPIN